MKRPLLTEETINLKVFGTNINECTLLILNII